VKFILIFGILLFSGCRSEEVAEIPESSQKARLAGHSESGETKVLPPAPDFTVSSIDGRTIKLSSLKGKVVLIDFWATWCGPCVYEIPGFIKLYDKYNEKGLEIIGLSVDRDRKAVVDFVKKRGVNYTVAFADGEIQENYGGIRGIPTTFFVDREGRIAKHVVGARGEAFFENEIIKLLGGGEDG